MVSSVVKHPVVQILNDQRLILFQKSFSGGTPQTLLKADKTTGCPTKIDTPPFFSKCLLLDTP